MPNTKLKIPTNNQFKNMKPIKNIINYPITIQSLINSQNWDELQTYIQVSPQVVKSWYNGKLPLNDICNYRSAPLPIIQLIYKNYPESIQIHSKSLLRLPLHTAVVECLPLCVLDYLLKEYPKASDSLDIEGHTPLTSHLLYSPEPSLEVIQLLLKYNEGLIKVKDEEGWYPLHHSATCKDWDIVKYILKLYPEALEKKSISGMTPSDVALMKCNIEIRDSLNVEEEKKRIYYRKK